MTAHLISSVSLQCDRCKTILENLPAPVSFARRAAKRSGWGWPTSDLDVKIDLCGDCFTRHQCKVYSPGRPKKKVSSK